MSHFLPKNKSFLVTGNPGDLSFDINIVEPHIHNFVWEVSVTSVSMRRLLPEDMLVGLTMNFVEKSKYVAVFKFDAGKKLQTVYLKDLWIEFDYIAKRLELKLINLETGADIVSQDFAFIHAVFHRKA